MVRRAGEYNVVVHENFRGGTGKVEINNLFNPDEFNGAGRMFGLFRMGPGDSIGYHKHEGEQEAYYILEGEARYNENGTEIILKAGDMALCQDGGHHGVEVYGENPLVYIALITYTK